MARVPPAMLEVLDAAEFPTNADGLRQLAVARDAPRSVVEVFEGLPGGTSFQNRDEVEAALAGQPSDGELSDLASRVLSGVAAVESRDEAATVQAIAGECDLSSSDVEAALGELTARDLVREARVEETGGASGAGRRYSVRARPSPPAS